MEDQHCNETGPAKSSQIALLTTVLSANISWMRGLNSSDGIPRWTLHQYLCPSTCGHQILASSYWYQLRKALLTSLMQHVCWQRPAIPVRQTLWRRSQNAPKAEASNVYAARKLSSERLEFLFLWTQVGENSTPSTGRRICIRTQSQSSIALWLSCAKTNVTCPPRMPSRALRN